MPPPAAVTIRPTTKTYKIANIVHLKFGTQTISPTNNINNKNKIIYFSD